MKIFVDRDNIEKALRILKKKHAPILKEYRERRYYKKPSEIRRERDKEARRKIKRKKRKE